MIKQDLSWIPESLEGHTLNIGGPANIGIAYRNYSWLHSFVHFGDLSNVVEDIRRLCTELDNGVCKNYVCYYSPRPADEEHAQLITDYRNFSYIHLPMLFLQQNSRCELLDVNTLPPIQTEFTKNFITLNNRIGPQRYEIFTYLRDNNLLDTGYVSYRNVYRDGPENLDSENHNWIIDKPYCNFNETITEYQTEINRMHYPVTDFLFDIAVETYGHPVFLTEKGIKSLAWGKIPVIIGPDTGHVHYLEQLGFDIFRDIVDHTYDTVSDPVVKMELFLEQVKRIALLDTESLNNMFTYRHLESRLNINRQMFVRCNRIAEDNLQSVMRTNEYISQNREKFLGY